MSLELEIGQAVIEVAEYCFEKAGCPEDYCIQHSNGCGTVVFGGTNRLIWSAFRGWKIDKPYCSDAFIKAAEELLKA